MLGGCVDWVGIRCFETRLAGCYNRLVDDDLEAVAASGEPDPVAEANAPSASGVGFWSRIWRGISFLALFSSWAVVERTRPIIRWLVRSVGWIRRVAIILVGLLVGWLLYRFLGPALSPEALRDYLVAAAAMIGGATAIILSISLFLTQGVSSLYSDEHFESYASQRYQATYALIIAITLVLFGGGMYVAGLKDLDPGFAGIVMFVSLFLIAVVFTLIDLQYEDVRRRVSPASVIEFLRSRGVRDVRAVQRDAERAAGVIGFYASDADSRAVALAAAYSRLYQPSVANLERQINVLIEVSLRLADRGEDRAAMLGLEAACSLLREYMAARSTSSLLARSNAFLVAESDSGAFIARVLVRFNEAGKTFLRDGRAELSQYVVTVYSLLSTSAMSVRFIPEQNENPILEQVVGYLWSFVRDAAAARDIEVPFQSEQVMEDIAVGAAANGYAVVLSGLQEHFIGIARIGFALRETVTASEAVNACFKVIAGAFESEKISRRIPMQTAITGLATITADVSDLVASGFLPNDYASSQVMGKAYWELPATVGSIINRYEFVDAAKKRTYRHDLSELFDAIASSLRRLTRAIKSADSLLISGVAYTLKEITSYLIRIIGSNGFSDVASLRGHLTALIWLPYWFAREADAFDSGANAFQDLCDVVACDGLFASRLPDKDAVSACIEALSALAEQALQKGGNAASADSRVMLRACYLGVVALKEGWSDTVAMLQTKLDEFDAHFTTEYVAGLPEGVDPVTLGIVNPVLGQVQAWQRNFDYERLNGMRGLRNDAEEVMQDLVDESDIARFIEAVWGSA
jgi:hypothetical protein